MFLMSFFKRILALAARRRRYSRENREILYMSMHGGIKMRFLYDIEGWRLTTFLRKVSVTCKAAYLVMARI